MLSSRMLLVIWWPGLITRLTVRETELAGLTMEQVMAEAQLVTEAQEEGECRHLPRVRRTYQVTVIDDQGQETEELVQLLDTAWPHR